MKKSVDNQPKKSTDVGKQEEVVRLLWQFARHQQIWDLETVGSDGTKVNMTALRHALNNIMWTFGYESVEIQ